MSASSFQAQIQWRWIAFNDLSVEQMDQMYRLRQQVFVVEQNCPYIDADGKDVEAIHCLGFKGNELVATLRFFPRFAEFNNYASIGRVCSAESVRGTGVGRELMQQALAYADKNYAEQKIQIGAQSYLVKFYQSFGFAVIGEEYLEDDIPHKHMLRDLQFS